MFEKNKKAEGTTEEVLDVVEIEVFAKKGEKPPKAKRYKIRVDKEKYIVESETITGDEILKLAGKLPTSNYRLDQKLKGGLTKKIELGDIVDLTEPGLERFMTLPLDQQEG